MEPLTRFFLLRHAEVESRYHRVFGGKIDMDLSPLGRQQAEKLGDYLKRYPIDAIYASPMKRAQQTLEPIAQHFACETNIHPALHEVDFGAWTGLGWQELHDKHGVSAYSWLDMIEKGSVPQGETGEIFRNRIEPCVRGILMDNPTKNIALLAHGGVIRMILSILLDIPLSKTAVFEIDYASVTILDYRDKKPEVQLLNFTPWRDL
jgi:broad specificity phosphatase PhoE